MGSVQSELYENVKIIEIVNEYTLILEVNEKEKVKQITVKLKGIQPYDWTILEELNRSRQVRNILNSLCISVKQFSAEVFYENTDEIPECILLNAKNGTSINNWLITMGHVKRKK